MSDTKYKNFPHVPFLCGSSTLLLGDQRLASQFTAEICRNYLADELSWHYPEVVDEWNGEKNLEPPREILYQTLGRMICLGGNLIFLMGVTDELVEEYNNQDLTPPTCSVDPQLGDEITEIHGCTKIYGCAMNEQDYLRAIEDEEYYIYLSQPEYPQFDDFGNPTVVSWLREYALRAEDFSHRQKVDLFLNLSWNKPQAELPSPFWMLFDRIYELDEAVDGSLSITQTR